MKRLLITIIAIVVCVIDMQAQDAYISTDTSAISLEQQLLSDNLPKRAFQCNIEVGAQFTSNSVALQDGVFRYPSAGADLDVSLGVRTSKSVFVGAGVGFHSEFGDSNIGPAGHKTSVKTTIMTLPIYLDSRFYIVTKSGICPFVNANIGGYVPLLTKGEFSHTSVPTADTDVHLKGGFYAQVGLGLDIKRFQICIGYRMFTNKEWGAKNGVNSYGFIKMGVRIGKDVAQYKKP